MLSEVRRQPNEVEAPRGCWRRLRPQEIFTTVSVNRSESLHKVVPWKSRKHQQRKDFQLIYYLIANIEAAQKSTNVPRGTFGEDYNRVTLALFLVHISSPRNMASL